MKQSTKRTKRRKPQRPQRKIAKPQTTILRAALAGSLSLIAISFVIVIIFATLLLLEGCTTLGPIAPPPPTGAFCSNNLPANEVLCTDLITGRALPPQAISSTDHWVTFSPETWMNIQNYIDALIRALESANMSEALVPGSADLRALGVGYSAHSANDMVSVSLSDLKNASAKLKMLKKMNDGLHK